MATIKPLYGSNNQSITCTLASLANNGLRQSTAIDNSSNLFIDALVVIKVKSGSGTSSTGAVYIYAYGTVDGGSTYSDGATGSDGSFTPTSPTNLRLIGIINVVANTTTYTSSPMSVAAAFGGVLPDHWGIVVENKSGGSLDSTEGNHAKMYQGIQMQSA